MLDTEADTVNVEPAEVFEYRAASASLYRHDVLGRKDSRVCNHVPASSQCDIQAGIGYNCKLACNVTGR